MYPEPGSHTISLGHFIAFIFGTWFYTFQHSSICKRKRNEKLLFKTKFYRYSLGIQKREKSQSNIYIAMPFSLKWYIKKHLLLSFRFVFSDLLYLQKKCFPTIVSWYIWIHLVYFMFVHLLLHVFFCTKNREKKSFKSNEKCGELAWIFAWCIIRRAVVKQFQLPKWKFVKFTVKVFKREWKVAPT